MLSDCDMEYTRTHTSIYIPLCIYNYYFGFMGVKRDLSLCIYDKCTEASVFNLTGFTQKKNNNKKKKLKN